MANTGYVLSKELLDKIRRTNSKVDNLTNKVDTLYSNFKKHSRYFAKIIAKVSGAPTGCTYSASQVISDASGDFVAVSGGLSWGLDSTDVGVLIDVNSVNIVTDGAIDIDTVKIKADTVVECWYYGNEDGDVVWYCDANYNNFGPESGYPVDSGMQYDSTHPESALVDSGFPASGTSGFIITIQTGTSYDYLGNKILYAFYRDFTYDGLGRLVSVSVERRQVVDVTEACT